MLGGTLLAVLILEAAAVVSTGMLSCFCCCFISLSWAQADDRVLGGACCRGCSGGVSESRLLTRSDSCRRAADQPGPMGTALPEALELSSARSTGPS